jgi:hypothetical protein
VMKNVRGACAMRSGSAFRKGLAITGAEESV